MLQKVLLFRRFNCCLIVLFFFVFSAFSAQELKVGFVQGRGNDAQVEEQAFKNAEIEFEVLEKGDYKIDTLLKYDVIAVGVVAYDKNEPLKENFKVVNEYVEKGGYLVTVDFQQDSTWNKNFLPHPLALLDPDLEDNVGVILADHDIFKKPNALTDKHFGGGWGVGDFMADGPHEAPKPWKPLITDKQNKWPLVVWAKAGKGDVVFNSLQILQSLGRTGKKEVSEVLHNFLFWRGPRVVDAKGKLATTWSVLKKS
ncbi:TPA: hypothetical protein EYN98_17125 [Candidatus Poribacteria bacterium]|jgi:hypothetical protein|nr:hypothetical protein [Candidatus Poribacteria bacterium]HIB90090.1 hypothetical protein [Candidatus Poribacteria bacterium]HIB98899.1 hypothetical protein [Candidatus Poribacteria bacterium]HIM12436.1 hypothetical protein [Candidatus Poribacteria bacterium]HIO82006.1 hypothetical protein [Candidatus Poribacteria bacterium]